MAYSNNSIVTGKFSGSLNKEIVFRDWDGKTVVAKSPKRGNRKATPAQEQLHRRFLIASRYAKAVKTNTDQSLAQAYATVLRPRQNVYSRALEDFMSPPVVEHVDTHRYTGAVSDEIVIRAIDDFRVTEVRVEIYGFGGRLLETGKAQQNVNGIDWTYKATQVNTPVAGSKIKAIAVDVPGNEGTLTATM